MNRKTLLPIAILAPVLSLLVYACMVGDETDDLPIATETFETTALDGQCYQISLARMPDNRVVFSKKLIACSEGSAARIGVYDTRNTEIGRKAPAGSSNYWYIPFDGAPQSTPGSPTVNCYCEKQRDASYGWGGCNGQGTCWAATRGQWIFCDSDPCCEDCDSEICFDTKCIPIGNGGIIIEADTIVTGLGSESSDREENMPVYYGNRVKIEISKSGNTLIVYRTPLNPGEIYPANLYNLTSLEMSAGRLGEAVNGLHWFVPFEMGSPARSIFGQTPHCVSDGCTGDCVMQQGNNGCLVCNCTKEQEDCDLEPSYIMGGLLLQTQNIQIIDN